MVAWNDDLREGEGAQKGACGLEFFSSGTLCEVARHRDEVGLELFDDRDERLNEGMINPPEMQVREVDKRPHGHPAV